MPANIDPIFAKTPVTNWFTGNIAANTATDGTGTISEVVTAAVDGTRIEYLRIMPLGTNIQTVMRVFLNNGSPNSVAANNSLIGELTLPANTLSQTQAANPLVFPVGFSLKSGFKIFVTIGTAVAAGFDITAIGGDY
jgi:hypothetical protein